MSEEQKRPPEGREENLSGGDAFKVDLYFWLQALVMALVSLILLFTFVGRVIGVQGSSMVPTLHDKDMLLLQSIGYEPKPEDIDITGLDGVTVDTIKGLLDVDKELWLEDVKGVEELYAQIGDHVPAELHAEAAALRERLSK